MSGDSTYSAQPLCLPHCWPVGDTIGPIVITYDGPSLVGATIELIFSNGQTLVGTAVAAPETDYPDRFVITFDAFEPQAPLEGEDSVDYKIPILYGAAGAPMVKRTIVYGDWHLKVIE